MNNLFYNDWFIIDNIAIKDVANMVKKGIKTTLPISLRSRSTTGGRAKQYELFKYFKNNSALNKLKERILANINKSLQLQVSDLKLVSAWTVLGYKNSYHTLHRHNTKQNHISCVLYLSVPNSKSKKDGSLFYVYNRDQEINYGIHKPRAGELVIFPIWLWHGTYPQSKGLRQTLNLEFETC